MQKTIGDDEINHELTEKIRRDPKYELYKTWLRANGVIWKDVDFPVAFGPTGVVGVAASKDIPACSGIIAVPNQLLITLTKVKESELGKIIEQNPRLFKQDTDGDFNVLTLFVLREKIKGKDSFYYPMINVIDDSTILLHWDQEDIKELEDPYILKETKEFEAEMNKTWEDFLPIFEQNRDLFPLDKFTKEDFFWCYEAVMTRCFGWSLPTTMLVPMADFLNHSADGTTHYMVNKGFERNEEEAPSIYVTKKRKVDLSLFDDEEIRLTEEDREIYFAPSSERINYIKKYFDFLSEESKQKLYDGNYTKQDQKKMVQEINLNALQKEKSRQAWDLSWFDSSDDEDNDTDEDESGNDEEKQENPDAAHKSDAEKMKHGRKDEITGHMVFEDEQVKENQSTQLSGLGEKEEKKGDEGDDEEDEGEEEEESEDNEEARAERDQYKYGKGIVTEKFSPTKYMKYKTSEYEKEEIEKLKTTELIKPEALGEEESEAEASDDSDWTWFEDSDKNNYFVVATHPYLYYRKGDQIFNCYGRRTNRFLLMWYGFCLKDNRYNSLSFRLWMNKSALKDSNPPKKILFKDYITDKEWENKAITGGEEDSNPQELTKEFKIKTSRLCEDALAYLRAQLLLTYKGLDFNKISVTVPATIPYEEFVIDYAIALFIEIKKQFSTTIAQDEEILKDKNLNWRKRFAVVYRMEQKKIADLQIRLLKVLLYIMEKLKAGTPLKDAYMEYVPSVDQTDEEFIEHRRKIANYLKSLYNNCN